MITVEDYDEYCHYVAGIVGLGLSRLMHASGLEGFQPDNLSNSMGLFLQVCIMWISWCLSASNVANYATYFFTFVRERLLHLAGSMVCILS